MFHPTKVCVVFFYSSPSAPLDVISKLTCTSSRFWPYGRNELCWWMPSLLLKTKFFFHLPQLRRVLSRQKSQREKKNPTHQNLRPRFWIFWRMSVVKTPSLTNQYLYNKLKSIISKTNRDLSNPSAILDPILQYDLFIFLLNYQK